MGRRSSWHLDAKRTGSICRRGVALPQGCDCRVCVLDAPAICRQAAGGDHGLCQLAIRPATGSETAPTGLSRSARPGREPRHGSMHRSPQWASHLSAGHFVVDTMGRASSRRSVPQRRGQRRRTARLLRTIAHRRRDLFFESGRELRPHGGPFSRSRSCHGRATDERTKEEDGDTRPSRVGQRQDDAARTR